MIKYRTSNGTVAEFHITEEDDNSVTISGRVERKRSNQVNWHDTWDDAKEFLVSQAYKDVEAASANLKYTNRRWVRLRALTHPNDIAAKSVEA
jgi:hypothetical protein